MTQIDLPEDGSWWDWEILSWNGWQLRLASGPDLTYHHNLELVFSEVAFVACPAQFSDPLFREPTTAERDNVQRYVDVDPQVLVAFDIESNAGDGLVACLVAAKSVQVVHGLVYRYWREDLKPGESLAPFVKEPGTD